MSTTNNIALINKVYREATGNVISFGTYNLAVITTYSTRIEGSQLFLRDVLAIQKNNQVKNTDIVSVHMVKDHAEALKYVLENSTKRSNVSEQIIKEICRKVVKNTGSPLVSVIGGDFSVTNADYRLATVTAGPVTFVDYKKVPGLMQELVKFINDQFANSKTPEESYKLSFLAHYDLVQIHPFGDGNGRTARLLMNYIQNYFELPLTAILPEDKYKYFQALNISRKLDDKEIFVEFMAKQHIKFIKKQLAYIQTLKDQEKKNSNGFKVG